MSGINIHVYMPNGNYPVKKKKGKKNPETGGKRDHCKSPVFEQDPNGRCDLR